MSFIRYYPETGTTAEATAKSPTNFLAGKTEANIYQAKFLNTSEFFIDVTGAIPGGGEVANATCTPVIYDSDQNLFYVQINATKYYIYPKLRNENLAEKTGVFHFYVNPNNISPQYRKGRTPRKTLGGWEVQHWGNELTELTVNGTSGGMHRINENGVNVGLDLATQTVRDSTAWKRLEELRQIYYRDQAGRNKERTSLWTLVYQGRYYIGTFASFSGPDENAEQPFQLKYSFTFVVEKEITLPLTNET
jgi:hypothetical protein